MKSFRNASFFVVATILVILLFVAAGPAYAANQLVSFQGRVLQAGSPVSGGSLTVTIWSNQTGGSLLYSDNFANAVNDGFFDLMLGSSSELNLTYGTFYYLDVSINGEDANWTSPSEGTVNRIQFQSQNGQIPPAQIQYNAINASQLQPNAVNSSHIQNDAIVSAKIGPSAINSSHLSAGLALTGNGSIDSPTLFVDSTSHRVGIGTANPTQKLEVARNNTIKVGNAYMSSGVIGADPNDAAAFGNNVWFNGSTWVIPANKTSALLLFINQTTSFYQTQTAGQTDWVERLSITNSGNVTISSGNLGIGATNPGTKLSFGSSVPNVPLIIATLESNAVGIGMDSSTAGTRIAGDPSGGTQPVVDMGYYAGSNAIHANWRSKMVVLGNGNVGIGTTSPLTKLDVNGSAGNPLNDPAYANFLIANFNNTGGIDKQSFIQVSSPSDTAGLVFKTSSNYASATDGWAILAYGGTLRIANDTGLTNIKVGSPLKGISVTGTNGYVGINTGNPTYALTVSGNAAKTQGGTAWVDLSDRRFKDVRGGITDALDTVMKLKPVRYTWNELRKEKFGDDPGLKYGFISQELKEVIPEFVKEDKEGYLWYDPSGFEAIHTAAIQEQQKQIERLKAENSALKQLVCLDHPDAVEVCR